MTIALFLAPAGAIAADAAAGPHLFYILADDYGWANVGFHSPQALTPHIDALATTEGFELSRLYAYRFCSPSRSSLMSGRLPYHVNQNNSASWGWTKPTIDPRMTTLPQKLQQAGYYTVQAGKWHLGSSQQAFTPAGRGFNESLTMLSGSENHETQRDGMSPAAHPPNGSHPNHVDLWATSAPALGRNGIYSAELFGGYAVDAIREHAATRAGVPLFMYLAFTVTHEPITAPQRFVDLYPADWVAGRRVYMGMASALDEAVGNVTGALRETRMWATSLVVFSSDNGGPSLVGGPSFGSNYPLRGGKGNAFEGATSASRRHRLLSREHFLASPWQAASGWRRASPAGWSPRRSSAASCPRAATCTSPTFTRPSARWRATPTAPTRRAA
jgi:arylsulfatase I/J